MNIAVVILNWNGKSLLEKFLPSVLKFSDDVSIYVVDNASTDESMFFLENNFPSVKIIKNKENYGFAKGYNEALKNINADVFALVNSDIEVTKNWLQPIINIFEKEANTAIVQPKILDFKNKDFFEYAGAAGGFIDKYGYPFCRGRIFNSIEKDLGQYDDDCEIFWASGACFFIRSSVYKSLSGFDDDFFAHQEEIDLCWRAFNKGFKTRYTSKSIVYHVGGATLHESDPKKTYLNFRNSLFMLTKNIPKKTLFQIILLRLFLDGIAGIRFLFQGKINHFFAVIKAHFYFYINLSVMLKKRTDYQIDIYNKTNSIVYQYYLKNVNKFKNVSVKSKS